MGFTCHDKIYFYRNNSHWLLHIMMIPRSSKIQLLIIFLFVLHFLQSKPCSPNSQQFLITFHPHLDAFWLNSDSELKDINFTPAPFLYEMNQRNSKTILNSMLSALAQNTTRKYFITEVVFFKDWYEYLDHENQLKVQRLLTNKQFQIVNGGWVENDEAVCYFDDIIDQYTLGLHYLKSKLNYEVRIGWATDSFGHSHSQAALLHLLGFQFQAIQRVDDRYIHQRNNNSLLEFYWSPVSDSNNFTYGGVATYVRHFLHEVNNLRTTTPESVAEDFNKLDKVMKKLYHKPKMFRFLGNDFEQFISSEFQTLEKAMNLLNERSHSKQCPIFTYGNPSDYLNLLKQEYSPKDMPVRQEDFMPNWDQDHYWTGYYTTDPDLKKVCKDFSRLVNLFRKIYIKKNYLAPSTQKIIDESNQLLALMQHHDGITATSKRHIEKQLKQRMRSKSQEIIQQVLHSDNIPRQACLLYKNGNKCSLSTQEKTVYLSILHQGSAKTQRIEVQLPKDVNYQINGHRAEYFCFAKLNKCYLVFEADILPGDNVFQLNKVEANTKNEIVNIEKVQGLSFSGHGFKVDLRTNQIDYTFSSNQYFNISLVKARSEITMTQTVAWNKYGQKEIKQERRIPGMYIMTNNGQLEPIYQGQYTELYVGVGNNFTKIYAYSRLHSIALTVRRGAQHFLDLQTEFQPPNYELSDYFLKVESHLNPKDEFYHDMNGYLVKKRKMNTRADYEWEYKALDKIAANTYPFCSFGYVLDHEKKLVVFTDRAGGISLFDKAIIINIDRITSDDYKGVGQAYMEIVSNIFRHKVSMVTNRDFIERKWQKEFDEALVGSFSKEAPEASKRASATRSHDFVKYSVFTLSKSQFILRLMNLHDIKEIRIPRYNNSLWNLEQLGLNLSFQSLQDSFVHGGPIGQRRHWKDIPNQINMFNFNQSDSQEQLVFKPLQIRSFRITLKHQNDLSSSGKAASYRQKNQLKTLKSQSRRGKGQIHQANLSKNKGRPSKPGKTTTQTNKSLSSAHFHQRCF